MESPKTTEIRARQRAQEAAQRIRAAVSRAFADEMTRHARWRTWRRRELLEGVSRIAMNARASISG